MSKELIIIAGPTAVGKSSLAVKLAEKIGSEIISADSMQVYRGMDIGSAKITAEEMHGVRHHMIDIMDPSENFDVTIFKKNAQKCIKDISSRGMIPIIAGGTGFYIQSVLYGIEFANGETDDAVRLSLEDEAARYGLMHMEAKLEEADPEALIKDHGNMKRIIRALEYNILTGKKMSDKNAAERNRKPVYDTAFFCITMPRDILYNKINERVDSMMASGLLEEVDRLRQNGISENCNSMQGLGYKQLSAYLDGRTSLDDAVEDIKQETRHFAKRQLTWFRREKNVIWIDRTDFPSDDGCCSEDKITDYMVRMVR